MSEAILGKSLTFVDDASLTPEKPAETKSTNEITTHEKKLKQLQKIKPVRPLSAYNIFFQLQREHILQGNDASLAKANQEDVLRVIEKRCKSKESDAPKRKHCRTHGKIGFTDLARKIAGAWKTLDKENKSEFQAFAEKEKKIYDEKMAAWREAKAKLVEAQAECRFKEFLRTSNTLSNSQFQKEEPVSCDLYACEMMGNAECMDNCWQDDSYPMYSDQALMPDTRSTFNEALDMVGEAYDMTKSMIGYQDFENFNYYETVGQTQNPFEYRYPMITMRQPSRQPFPNTVTQTFYDDFEGTPYYQEGNFDSDFAVWDTFGEENGQVGSLPAREHGMPRKVSLYGEVGGAICERKATNFSSDSTTYQKAIGVYYDVIEDTF